MKTFLAFCITILFVGPAQADIILVENGGFEDTSGQTEFNEFTFGTPTGWSLYDPNSISGAGVFTGTLEPNGIDFFDEVAPEGVKVAILFNDQRQGDGEYGFQQDFAEVLEANTRYRISVEVGNIGSGTAQNGVFYDLSGFPGYRVDLLAGGTVIAEDDNSLIIPERQWDTSVVEFTTGDSHALLGQALSIRLVNLNVIPAGYNEFNTPDLEVDFDDVRFEMSSVPEPSSLLFLTFSGISLYVWHKRKKRDLSLKSEQAKA